MCYVEGVVSVVSRLSIISVLMLFGLWVGLDGFVRYWGSMNLISWLVVRLVV